MSAYFSEMDDRVQTSPVETVLQVCHRVTEFLCYYQPLVCPADQPKIAKFFTGFPISIWKPPEEYVRQMHLFMHRLAEAKIKLNNGDILGDNPYYPGHHSADE